MKALTRTTIYPHRIRTFENAQDRIRNWKGSQKNREFLLELLQHMLVKKDGYARIYKVTTGAKGILEMLGKDFYSMTYKDAQAIVARINTHPTHRDATKNDNTRALKFIE